MRSPRSISPRSATERSQPRAARAAEYRPGPGTYNPTVAFPTRSYTIPPLPPKDEVPDGQDKEALVAYEKKKRFHEELYESKHRKPDFGAYDLPTIFSSPRSPRNQCEQLNGTPRSERTLLNVDLLERSKLPGPGEYTPDKYGCGGRDRFYRKKLALEKINFMAPTLPQISPRKS